MRQGKLLYVMYNAGVVRTSGEETRLVEKSVIDIHCYGNLCEIMSTFFI